MYANYKPKFHPQSANYINERRAMRARRAQNGDSLTLSEQAKITALTFVVGGLAVQLFSMLTSAA